MNLPDKKYAVIYADPPWSYRQCGTGPKSRGNAAQHYNTMTTDDICALPVKNLAGGGSVCFMWATFPQIADALRVMEAWGFKYKTCAFVWIKKNRKSNTNFWGSSTSSYRVPSRGTQQEARRNKTADCRTAGRRAEDRTFCPPAVARMGRMGQ